MPEVRHLLLLCKNIIYMMHTRQKKPMEKKRPRVHYTCNGKAKQEFESEKDARRYMTRHKISDMKAYFCNVCNKWHIGHVTSF